MAFYLGMDVGLIATKAVLLQEDRPLAHVMKDTGVKPAAAVRESVLELLSHTGSQLAEIEACVVTGWGAKRVALDFGFETLIRPEVPCLIRGARWACPTCATIVDVGAQITTAARFNEKGRVKRYEQSDKCASGAGRFLDIMAGALGLKIEELARVGASASQRLDISAQCSVFAESEIISCVNSGEPPENIVDGINYSIARRVSTIAMRVGVRPDAILTGGVAKNSQVAGYLADLLEIEFKDYPADPQILGAIGAGLLAGEG